MPRKPPVSLWPVRSSDRIRERAELIAIKAEEEAAAIQAKDDEASIKATALIKPEPFDLKFSFDPEVVVDVKSDSIDQPHRGSQAKVGKRSGRNTRRERAKQYSRGMTGRPKGVTQADSILKQRSTEVKRAIAEAVARSHRLGARRTTTAAVAKATLKCHREATRARSKSCAPVTENRDWAMPSSASTSSSSSSASKARADSTQGFLGPDSGELLFVTGMLKYFPEDPQWIRALLRGWLYSFFANNDPSLNPLAAIIHGMPRPGEIIHGIAIQERLILPGSPHYAGENGPWGGIRRLWSIPILDPHTKRVLAIVRTDQVACWLRIRISELFGFLALAHPLEWRAMQHYLKLRLHMTFFLKMIPEIRACFQSAADFEAGVVNDLYQLPERDRSIATNLIKMDHDNRRALTVQLYHLVVQRRKHQLGMVQLHQKLDHLLPRPPQGYEPPHAPSLLATPALSTSPSSRSSSVGLSPSETTVPPATKWWCLPQPFNLTIFQHQVELLLKVHDQVAEYGAHNYTQLRGSFGLWDPEMSTDPKIYLDKAHILDRVMLQHDHQHHVGAKVLFVRNGHCSAGFNLNVRPACSALAKVPRLYAVGNGSEQDEHILQSRQRDALDSPPLPLQ
ncbi:hypothetical protein MVEG_03501 [Podila verticillata NRRL 6337]|nr:hypothetical protein MVEG_03501 [Podila verticillata NRRL 6337]